MPPDEGVEPCAIAEVLPRLELRVVLPLGGAPMAVEPLWGAPMAVLPGVVGPEDMPPLEPVLP